MSLLEKVEIRLLRESDVLETSALISRTYKTCNYMEGESEAVKRYVDHYDPDKNDHEVIKAGFRRLPLSYVAVLGERVIGVIRGTESRVVNLFVDPRHHRLGIATMLLNRYEEEIKKIGSSEIKMRASLYGVPFYQKSGYKKTTGVRTMFGLKIQPMKKLL